jgi:predicted metal-dependent hydrolase
VQLSFLFENPFRKPAAPETGPSDTNGRTITLSNGPLSYQLRRTKRRSIGFQIDDRGLVVSAPRWVSLRDIETAIQEKERWIITRLDQWQRWRSRQQLPNVRFADGGQLPFLGQTITLRLTPDGRGHALVEQELHLALPADADEARVRDTVQVWLKSQAQQILGQRLDLLASRHGLTYSAWSLSSARSRWGSCGADGKIRLNWRLIHFSESLIDYVVAHELAHLKELNHGPEFWAQVGRLMPGFEIARDHMRREDPTALPF